MLIEVLQELLHIGVTALEEGGIADMHDYCLGLLAFPLQVGLILLP